MYSWVVKLNIIKKQFWRVHFIFDMHIILKYCDRIGLINGCMDIYYMNSSLKFTKMSVNGILAVFVKCVTI